MANYYEYSTHQVLDPSAIGLGTGDTTSGRRSDGPQGELRICVSLAQIEIPWPEGEYPEGRDWIAFNPESVLRLVDLLDSVRHLWDNPEVRRRLNEIADREVCEILSQRYEPCAICGRFPCRCAQVGDATD